MLHTAFLIEFEGRVCLRHFDLNDLDDLPTQESISALEDRLTERYGVDKMMLVSWQNPEKGR